METMDRWAKLWEYHSDGHDMTITTTDSVEMVRVTYYDGSTDTLRWDHRDQEWHAVLEHERSLTE